MSGSLEVAGYVLAVLLLVTYPIAIVFWLLIHPFAAFWRRLGPAISYTAVGVVCAAIGLWIYQYHEPLLATRWPFRWPLAAAGLLLYGASVWTEIQCRRYLKLRILVGAPELGADRGRVLRKGIYGRLRHPRYLAVILGTLGWALIINYPTVHVVTLAAIPLFYLVIVFEERELVERFGAEYEAYRAAVPRRLVPRLR